MKRAAWLLLGACSSASAPSVDDAMHDSSSVQVAQNPAKNGGRPVELDGGALEHDGEGLDGGELEHDGEGLDGGELEHDGEGLDDAGKLEPDAGPVLVRCTAPAYRAGTAYAAGQRVTSGHGEYQCRAVPLAQYCGRPGYEPGRGAQWTEAWWFLHACMP